MLVKELIAQLSECNPEARVMFDTEAGTFHYHMADIDKCYDMRAEESPDGKPFVSLHTKGAIDHSPESNAVAAGRMLDMLQAAGRARRKQLTALTKMLHECAPEFTGAIVGGEPPVYTLRRLFNVFASVDKKLLHSSDPTNGWQGIKAECKGWENRALAAEAELTLCREREAKATKKKGHAVMTAEAAEASAAAMRKVLVNLPFSSWAWVEKATEVINGTVITNQHFTIGDVRGIIRALAPDAGKALLAELTTLRDERKLQKMKIEAAFRAGGEAMRSAAMDVLYARGFTIDEIPAIIRTLPTRSTPSEVAPEPEHHGCAGPHCTGDGDPAGCTAHHCYSSRPAPAAEPERCPNCRVLTDEEENERMRAGLDAPSETAPTPPGPPVFAKEASDFWAPIPPDVSRHLAEQRVPPPSGAPSSMTEAQVAFERALDLCRKLGFTVDEKKLEALQQIVNGGSGQPVHELVHEQLAKESVPPPSITPPATPPRMRCVFCKCVWRRNPDNSCSSAGIRCMRCDGLPWFLKTLEPVPEPPSAAPAQVASERPQTNKPQVMDRAFLVGVFDKDTGEFLGADIFSEETPTLGTNRFVFTIATGRGTSYMEARMDLAKKLDPVYADYKWVRRHIRLRGEPLVPVAQPKEGS